MGRTKKSIPDEKADQVTVSAIAYTIVKHISKNKTVPFLYRRRLSKTAKMIKDKAEYLDWFGANKEALVYILSTAIIAYEAPSVDAIARLLGFSPRVKKLYEECMKEAEKRVKEHRKTIKK